MPRRTAIAFVALSATAGLLVGCGSSSSGGGSTPASNNSSLSPQAELTSAVTALGSASTVTMSLKLAATGSQLLSFIHQQDKSLSLTPKEAAEVAGLQVSFEAAAPSGKTLSNLSGLSAGGAANVSVSDAGTNLATIRFVGQVLYLQLDLKDVLNAIGKASIYRQITSAEAQLPAFIKSLVQGKWVSLPLSTLKGLTNQLGVTTPPTSDASKSHQLIQAFEGLLTKDVTVVRSSSGSSDVLTLTANLKTLAGGLTSTFASEIPGTGAALGKANLSGVPNKNVTLTAGVTDGSLSSLTFDLGQIAKSGQGSLPVALTFARTGAAITKPAGAVAVDLSSLGSLLGAFTQGLSQG